MATRLVYGIRSRIYQVDLELGLAQVSVLRGSKRQFDLDAVPVSGPTRPVAFRYDVAQSQSILEGQLLCRGSQSNPTHPAGGLEKGNSQPVTGGNRNQRVNFEVIL